MSGSTTLRNATISNNSAFDEGGGIYNDSVLIVTKSIIMGNIADDQGGGIRNRFGKATIIDSTISNNMSGTGGGGIRNSSSLILINSTIYANEAGWSGGGIQNNLASSITLSNATISGNIAKVDGGGVYNVGGGAITMTNTTINANRAEFNGGSIFNVDGTASIINTIVTNNDRGNDCFGVLTSNGHNISSDGTCTALTATGDMVGTNPLLGLLQDNGGDTLTHALLLGSPAVDAGDDTACPATDQRGMSRTERPPCDIGAYERPLEMTHLPIILKDWPLTELSVFNDNTGNDVIFTVRDQTPPMSIRCTVTVPNNDTKLCGTFPAGTYKIEAIAICGTSSAIKTYADGPQTTRIFCN